MNYENIALGIVCEAEEILSLTERYLAFFKDTPSIFASVPENDIKKAHTRYRRYTSNLLIHIDNADNFAAELSALVRESDIKMNNEETMRASLLFDGYCRWKRSVSDFMSECDLMFTKEKSSFRYSALTASAQKFYESTKFLKGMPK